MKKHKFEFTADECARLYTEIGFYNFKAVETKNYKMLLEREILVKLRSTFYRRMFDMQFSSRKTSKVSLVQIQVDVICRALAKAETTRNIIERLQPKTQLYAA